MSHEASFPCQLGEKNYGDATHVMHKGKWELLVLK